MTRNAAKQLIELTLYTENVPWCWIHRANWCPCIRYSQWKTIVRMPYISHWSRVAERLVRACL